MTGVDLLLLAACGAAALLLVGAGIGHMRHRRLFAATLDAQRLLPPRLRPAVAALMGPLELVLGVALLAGPTLPGPVARFGAALVGLLYLALAAYVAVVWRTRPRVPCGCFGSQAPASGWTVLRALALGAACAVLALLGPGLVDGADRLVAAAGALVLTGVCWLLPELG